eukprot:6208414-Pleurochrysis_carterae.AAC.6
MGEVDNRQRCDRCAKLTPKGQQRCRQLDTEALSARFHGRGFNKRSLVNTYAGLPPTPLTNAFAGLCTGVTCLVRKAVCGHSSPPPHRATPSLYCGPRLPPRALYAAYYMY